LTTPDHDTASVAQLSDSWSSNEDAISVTVRVTPAAPRVLRNEEMKGRPAVKYGKASACALISPACRQGAVFIEGTDDDCIWWVGGSVIRRASRRVVGRDIRHDIRT
jgi:hypothetical protein